MNKEKINPIEILQYRTIEKGFYQVHASDEFKIIIEGNVCGGILLKLMEQTKKDKGKIVRVRSKEDLWDDETKELIRELKEENKHLKTKVRSIKNLMRNA